MLPAITRESDLLSFDIFAAFWLLPKNSISHALLNAYISISHHCRARSRNWKRIWARRCALVRRAAPGWAVADLIGRTHYRAINGALTLPTMVAKALAPVVTAVIWSAMGDPSFMLWTLLGSAIIGAVGFVFALSGTSSQEDGMRGEA
jgi:hypothetical protein